MTLKNLANKKIALLGLGVENYALLKFLLARKVACQVVIYEKKQKEDIKQYSELSKFKNVSWSLGEYYAKDLSGFDIIFRSPGSSIRKDKQVKLGRAVLTTAMNLFFDLSPTKNIIGVTGTKGKGTTSSLIYEILKAGKKKVWLGGNIGVAPFAFITKIKPTDWVVLELSSFQLEDLTKSPKIAVMTNFTKEHLAPADPNNPNYHTSLKEYLQAKMNITRWQKKGDYFVVNSKSQITNTKKIPNHKSQIINQTKARIITFDKSDFPSSLPGEHNKENIAAAVVVAQLVKIASEVVLKAVKNFKGLEHRIELVRELKGVKYYDDSFATTPESAVIALKSFSAPVILLAGGADKGADFKNFAKEIAKRVKFVCLLKGLATPRLKQSLIKAGFGKSQIKEFTNLNEAVKTAKSVAKAGDIVLLSTACASFGMFKSYKQRGDLFKHLVKRL